MRKFMVKTKRFLAIALTAAMMIGETTTSFAATVKQNAISQESTENAQDSTENTQDSTTEKAVKKAPIKAKNNLLNALDKPLDNPGKVTGVCLKNTDLEINNPRVYWNALTTADGYEVRLYNATEEYSKSGGYTSYYDGVDGSYKNKLVYISTSSNSVSVYNGKLYAAKIGTIKPVMNGTYNKTITNGTYKLQVRAYNSKKIDGRTYYNHGAWSDPINFTYNKSFVKPFNITGLKYSLVSNGEYALSIPYISGDVEFEIKDSEGYIYSDGLYSDGSLYYYQSDNSDVYFEDNGTTRIGFYPGEMTGLRKYKLGNNNEYIDYGNGSFVSGKKYTVRCRNYISSQDSGNGEKLFGAWSNAVTFTYSGINSALSKTGNIHISGQYLYWNEVSGAQFYELQITNTTTGVTFPIYTADSNNYYIGSTSYNGSKLTDRGNFTVKIRAGYENEKSEKVYGDWAVGSYCYEQPVTSLPKVEGVAVSDDGVITWNSINLDTSLVVLYEYEVKDTTGRLYTKEYGVYPDTNSLSVASGVARSLYSFKLVDGEYVKEKDSLTGNNLYAFAKGKSFLVRVRAKVVTDGKTIYGAWSDVCTKTMPANYSSGYNWKPAQVTGVWIQTESNKDYSIEYPTLRWNSIRDVSCYQVEIVDSKGNVYSDTPRYIGSTYTMNYQPAYNNYIALKPNLAYSYSINGNEYSIKTDASGKTLRCMNPGETYKLRVRAVNKYSVRNGYDDAVTQSNIYYGDWSDYVTYTQGAVSTQISNFKYVKRDLDENYLFSYDTTADRHNIYYQVATDKNFSPASLVVDWTQAYNDKYDLSIHENALFKNNVMYYVRIVYSDYDLGSRNIEANEYKRICAGALVTSFRDNKNNSVKAINGFRLDSVSTSDYNFMFDTKIDTDIEHYEIQVATNKNSTNWSILTTDQTAVSVKGLSKSILYFRAISYKQITDANGITKKIYGKASNIVTVDHRTNIISPVGKLSYMGETKSTYIFHYNGTIKYNESLMVEVANTKNFSDNKNRKNHIYTISKGMSSEIEVNKTDLHPNQTYYIRAYVSNGNTSAQSTKESAYTNTVKFKSKFVEFKCYFDKVTENSISMYCSVVSNSNSVTGYEFQRKQTKGKKTKWVNLAKSTTSYYTDKKLKANKKYSYRVRAYYFNDVTKKTVYSKWVNLETTTGWSDQLILKVGARTNNMIKLTWNKIKGAKGYEVYKMISHSDNVDIKNGYGDSYCAYQLVKTLGKKATSYKDKKIGADNEYRYLVRAYKKVNGKKVYIDGNVTVSAEPRFSVVKYYNNSKGQLVVNWQPIVGAKKYVIEKYNNVTQYYEPFKTIKKGSVTSYKFPAAKDTSHDDSYKIFVYLKNNKIITATISNSYILKAPTNVKAKVVKNGIKISWNKVKGADFYRVYRTTSPYFNYNKDLKGYNVSGASAEIRRYVADSTCVSGYKALSDYEANVSSVVDRKVTHNVNGKTYVENWGPLTGVKYYYYVVAYKYQESEKTNDHNYLKISSLSSKLVSAKLKGAKPGKTKIKKATSKKRNITLKYKKIAKADGYEIARSAKSKKKGFKTIKTVSGANKVTFKDKNSKKNKLKKKKYYYYKIRAYKYDEAGNKIFSKYSAVKKVKCK